MTRASTPSGRWHARYDPEALLLVLACGEERPPAFAFNVGGAVWFDCDADAVLRSVTLNIRREFWRPTLAEPWPEPTEEGELVVDRIVAGNTVDGRIECTCNPSRTSVVVAVSAEPWNRGVALSDSCAALLRDSVLVGFFVRSFATMRMGGGDVVPAQIW